MLTSDLCLQEIRVGALPDTILDVNFLGSHTDVSAII